MHHSREVTGTTRILTSHTPCVRRVIPILAGVESAASPGGETFSHQCLGEQDSREFSNLIFPTKSQKVGGGGSRHQCGARQPMGCECAHHDPMEYFTSTTLQFWRDCSILSSFHLHFVYALLVLITKEVGFFWKLADKF